MMPTSNKDLLLVALGGGFWYAGALFIKKSPAEYFDGGRATKGLFVAIFPVTWLAVKLSKAVAKLESADEVRRAVAIMTTTAMFLDGAALTWRPSLYGDPQKSPKLIKNGAAFILWGAAAGMLLSFLE